MALLIVQTPIQTVYEPGNPTSHFNPIRDSAKIYYVFIRFSTLSIAAAIFDYCLFIIALLLSANWLFSVIFARLITGVFYFYLVKTRVFKSPGNIYIEMFKFAILVACSGLASFGLIIVQYNVFKVPVVFAKLVGELVLAFANFAIQRVFVFRSTEDVR